MNINKFSPVLIKKIDPKDARKLCSLSVNNNKAGALNVQIREDDYGNGYRFITELKNKCDKLLGKEVFTLIDKVPECTGLNIIVEPEYRNRHYYFGEILRLTSIIEMLENKIKTFEIYSKDSAIFFHSKFKFEPAIKTYNDRDYALNTVINNKSGKYVDFRRRALALLNATQRRPNDKNYQRELCKKTNILLKEYIQRILRKHGEYKHHPFNNGMRMVLTDKNILKNKEFFNELFRKHGIDYQI